VMTGLNVRYLLTSPAQLCNVQCGVLATIVVVQLYRCWLSIEGKPHVRHLARPPMQTPVWVRLFTLEMSLSMLYCMCAVNVAVVDVLCMICHHLGLAAILTVYSGTLHRSDVRRSAAAQTGWLLYLFRSLYSRALLSVS